MGATTLPLRARNSTMLFNSLTYFFFVAAVFVVYWRLKNKLLWQNLFVLAVSYFFYACWDWRFLILIVLSSITDFLVGKSIGNTNNATRKKAYLALSLLVNLGLLGFFKYFNFFVESAVALLHSIGLDGSESTLSIILPVGISFYTFQTLSYTIDVYRGRLEPTKNWIQFFAFVAFFPQLVAGPIERASNLLPQFAGVRTFNSQFAINGLRLILWGLFKKMVVADRLALVVDALYADPSNCNSWMALVAAIAFAFQVYCDFSGYSDIAIGTARLLGFKLMRNFKTPFLSKTQTEFWQRWHISLSTWFRDYLYIPLGGNRNSSFKWSLVVLLTFTVSGLWHGADFHYVLWGFVCAIPLVFEKVFRIKSVGALPNFLLFSIILILFRSEGVSSALTMYEQLFTAGLALPEQLPDLFDHRFDLLYTTFSVLVLVLAEAIMGKTDFDSSLSALSMFQRWFIYYALVLIIALFGIMDNAPNFIYFQF